MTKREKYQEINQLFYEFVQTNGYVAREGSGFWAIEPIRGGYSNEIFTVTKGDYYIDTQYCEDEKSLAFAKELGLFLENLQRMFEI